MPNSPTTRATPTDEIDLPRIEVVDDVGSARDAVEALAAAGTPHEQASALNEAALLNLRHPREGVRHLLARAGTDLVGYAQLEHGDDVDTVQLVVAPTARRRGIGTALLAAVQQQTTRAWQIWAPGDTPAAAALARRVGLRAVRALSIMTRPLGDDLPAPRLPAGVSIRAFRPGADEDAWLRVNGRAFAGHPEQGRITRADLDERMAESWFDPTGFLLAERDGAVIGFHWTKRHSSGLGEVYVIGVDPDAAGGGIGKALLYAGLAELRRQGCDAVELYVESDHTGAIALYRGAGFTESSRDVLYRSNTAFTRSH